MLTPEKLAARAWRRLQALGAGVAPRLEGGALSGRAPLSGLPWAVLLERVRAKGIEVARRRRRRITPELEQLRCELLEASDRAFVARRVRQLEALEHAAATWTRQDAERADAALVAEVAARRAAERAA